MNSVSVAIDNLLIAVSGQATTAEKSAQVHNKKRLTTTTPDAESSPSNESPPNFIDTLGSKIKSASPTATSPDTQPQQITQKGDSKPESKPKNPASQVSNKTILTSTHQTDSLPLAGESTAVPAVPSKAITAETANTSPRQLQIKTTDKPLQLLELPSLKSAPNTNKNLTSKAPQQTALPAQTATEVLSTDTKTTQLATGKKQIVSTAQLNPPQITTEQAVKNVDSTAVSNKSVVAAKVLATPENTQKPVTDVASITGKSSPDTQKPPSAVTSAASNSTQKPLLDTSLPVVESKSSTAQPELPKIAVVKSAAMDEKNANIEADAKDNSANQPTFSKSLPADAEVKPGNSPAEPFLKDLNPTQVRISTSQAKDGSTSSAGNDSSARDFGQVISGNNAQAQITEQFTTSSPPVKASGNPIADGPAGGIGQQIQASIHSSLRQGDQEITIRLNPPELGKVFIKFQEEKEQIIGILEVSRVQTRIEIQQQLPHIIRNLADSGIQIKRLDVISPETEQPGQQMLRDSSLAGRQDSSSGQQDTADTAAAVNNLDEFGINGWVTSSGNYEGVLEPQASATDNSINILI